MSKKILYVGLIGKTNAGKSTLINSIIGKKISIENKKVNTTLGIIAGIKNIKDTQIVFFDTPGLNVLNSTNIFNKKLKVETLETIYKADIILYIIDIKKYNYNTIINDLEKINKANKPVTIVFNKIDLINNNIILSYINDLNKTNLVKDFFNISAKYLKGIDQLVIYLISQSKANKWKFINNEVSDKDDIFITNECTRNAILKYLHKEIPYKLNITNVVYKVLKNKEIKIKQSIGLKNLRYKSIILGKNGCTIKRIRESSQNEIANIMKSKVHLYLQVNKIND